MEDWATSGMESHHRVRVDEVHGAVYGVDDPGGGWGEGGDLALLDRGTLWFYYSSTALHLFLLIFHILLLIILLLLLPITPSTFSCSG